MKYIAIITLLLIAAPLGLADNHVEATNTAIESNQSLYCQYLQNEIGMEVGDRVPGGIPYKNERIALFDLEGNNQGHVILEKKEVTSVGCDEISDATYHVGIKDTETIEAVFYSQSPLGAFDEQKGQDNIIVEGQSMGKSIKKSLSFAGIKVLGWFGL